MTKEWLWNILMEYYNIVVALWFSGGFYDSWFLTGTKVSARVTRVTAEKVGRLRLGL